MAKTNAELVAYCKAKTLVPNIYLLGGFGRKLTQAMIDRRLAMGCALTRNNLAKYKANIGKVCFDCVGLIKGYLWETSPGIVPYNIPAGSDQNVGMMYNSCKEKGLLAAMPDIPGILVFTDGFTHVGVYTGKVNGIRQYIECTTAWGTFAVVTSADSGHPQGHNRSWKYWGKHALVTYTAPVATASTGVIEVGSKVRIIGTNYATGEPIHDSYKVSFYTVSQMGNGKALLKELNSWVFLKDLTMDPIKVTPPVVTPPVAPIIEKIVYVDKIVEVEKPINAIFNDGRIEVTIKTVAVK